MHVHVKVKAGAKRELTEKISDDHFAVSVREKPERNMANKRVCEMIAEHFGVLPNKIKIISGHHSPSKILSVVII
ncbi:MAG: DUF167 domain-containing protein [Candidatus Pacebacteria bacterium]|nr:DUF167 domain-containing protein [Candidatus Paceibacterota bacterium]